VKKQAGRRPESTGIDFSSVRVLTFDCYGTLIDWEAGIESALARILAAKATPAPTEQLLEAYAAAEAELEAGDYLPYRDVLRRSARAVCARFGVQPTDQELETFAGSVADWPAFPDSRDALARLRGRFRLGVITNGDDDLFDASNERLGRPFDWVVTAEQARSYKPNLRGFELVLDQIGEPRDRVVHVAQSLYHDHVPAAKLGIRSVWIDRRQGRGGFGATPPASAKPTLTVPDLATLAELATGSRPRPMLTSDGAVTPA
jgi:2-haloacid dehalogenase